MTDEERSVVPQPEPGNFAVDLLDAKLEAIERQEQLYQKVKALCLKVTSPQDWDDLGGKPYLNISGAHRIASMLSISWEIEPAVREDHEDGHFTFKCEGLFQSPFFNNIQTAEGTRSSTDPFFALANGQPIPPKEIDRNKVRKGAYTNCKIRGVKALTGLDKVTPEEVNAALHGKVGQVSSHVEYGGAKMPFGPFKDKPVNSVPTDELKKMKGICLTNIKAKKYVEKNKALVDAIEKVLHNREMEDKATHAAPSEDSQEAMTEGGPQSGHFPESPQAGSGKPTEEATLSEAELEQQWQDFAQIMQEDPDKMLHWNRLKMKMHLGNPEDLPLTERIQFMRSCQDAMKAKGKKK